MFRELLQNADDASASAVEIHFETKSYIDGGKAGAGQVPPVQDEPLPDLKTTLVRVVLLPPCSFGLIAGFAQVNRWTLKNNGFVFRDEDWDRLKKIGTEQSGAGSPQN